METPSTVHSAGRGAKSHWLIAAIAAVGFLTAANFLVARARGGEAVLCGSDSVCGVVHASPYAMFVGVPTATWGALLYLVIGILAVVGLRPRRWLAAFLLSIVGVSFSAFLVYLAVLVTGGTCWYCLASVAIALGLVVALVASRPSVVGGRLRLSRIAVLAILTGVATVVAAATVFAITD